MSVGLEVKSFETLKTSRQLLGCNREIILSGFYPKVDPYAVSPERAFLRLRIQLAMDEEITYTVNELRQIFSEYFRVSYPKGRTEFCRSIVADKCYAELNYRIFYDNVARRLYEELKKDLF